MKCFGLGVATVLACVAGTASQPARAGADEALAAFKAGRYLEAAAEIQAVVDRSSGYAYGHFLLGHCLLKMGLVGDANREFRHAINLDPDRAEYYQGFALALNASGNWPLTVRAASEGLERAKDPRARFALLAIRGYTWGALRRWNDAVTDLEAAQRIRPEPWILVYLAKARFAMGSYAEAVPPLRRALAAAPDDPAILRLLAEDLLRLAAAEREPIRKKFIYTESLSFAQRLAFVTPDDLVAVHLVGRAALGAGNLVQAENLFRHVVAIEPRHCYALANLGRTYMADSRWDDAETYLRKAAACAPRLATVYDSLGDVYTQIGKPMEAAAAYRKSDSINPTRRPTSVSGPVPVFQPR